jgi:hypothetical protein
VPADWLGKPMRCRFCKNIFQTPAQAVAATDGAAVTATPAVLVAPPVTQAATAVAPVPATLAVPGRRAVQAAQPAIPVKQGGAGKVLLGIGCAVAVVVLAIPAGVLLVLALVRYGGTAELWPVNPEDPVELVNADHPVVGKDQGGKDVVAKGDGAKDAVAKDKKPPAQKDEGLKKDKDAVVAKPPPVKGPGLLPRRALLISVDNYLYLNSVSYGSGRTDSYPGSSIAALAAAFPNPPLRVPATQTFELSDGGKQPHSTELSVLKNAIKDYLDSSRAQDRVVILFAGHATDIDKDSYLIPISGRREDPDTLLPLSWVYDQLAGCKARQKVLILDVFRFPPALGFELPGAGASEAGEMGEVFDKNVQNPPEGVQVWTSCVKGQRSIEFEGGSVFLQALSHTLQSGPAMKGFIEGNTPLPFDQALVDAVNKRIKELVGAQKFEQTSRLSGSPPAAGAAYDPAEPMPPPLTLKEPASPGGQLAGFAEVNGILNEIKLLPPVRQTRAGEDRLLQAYNLPPFPAKVLGTYKRDDYKSVKEVLDRYQQDPQGFAKAHPVRALLLDAAEALRKSAKINMRETLFGPIDPKKKTAFLKEQREPGMMIFELEQVLGQMQTLGTEDLDKETSKRWRANFDFTTARLKARLVYIYEYSFLLGQVRRDELPALEPGQDGWRVGSRKKIQVTEPKAKTYAKEVATAWKEIQKSYPDTPWAVLAHRESLVALGLEWRPKKE